MNKEINIKKYKWKLTEEIDPMLSEEEIGDLINKKLAYVIIELEHNPASYIENEKNANNHCKLKKGVV